MCVLPLNSSCPWLHSHKARSCKSPWAFPPASLPYLFPTITFPLQLQWLRILSLHYSVWQHKRSCELLRCSVTVIWPKKAVTSAKIFGTPSSCVPSALRPSMAPWEAGNSYRLLRLLITLSYPPSSGYDTPLLWVIVSFFPCYPGGAPISLCTVAVMWPKQDQSEPHLKFIKGAWKRSCHWVWASGQDSLKPSTLSCGVSLSVGWKHRDPARDEWWVMEGERMTAGVRETLPPEDWFLQITF